MIVPVFAMASCAQESNAEEDMKEVASETAITLTMYLLSPQKVCTADEIAKLLAEKGIDDPEYKDAKAIYDAHEAVEAAFKYDKLVLATTTYNGDIFPFMKEFINHLTERNFQNRKVAFIENGSWAPMATKIMKGMLEKSKNLTYTEASVKILCAIHEENIAEIKALAEELLK